MSGANYARPETNIDQIEVLDLLCQDQTIKHIPGILSEDSTYTKGGRINKSAFGKKLKTNLLQTDQWLAYVRDLTMFYCGSTGSKPSRPHGLQRRKYKSKNR